MGPTPSVVRPVVSARPRARFMHWTAPPAVPLVRLSRAATATSRRAAASTATCTCTVLAPSVDWVCGHCPGAAGGRTARRRTPPRRPRTPARCSSRSASGVVQVARMPRDIGTRTGVKDTRGAAAPQWARFWMISGVCRWTAAHPVRAGRPHQLRAEQMGLERPARTGRTAGRHDHDVRGVGQARGDGGQQRQRRRGRVAPGHGDPPRPGQLLPLTRQLGQPVGPGAGVR